MTALQKQARRGRRESGIALLLCLIFLTSLTLLGLSASADVILQQQLSANLKETERAGQSAQAALDWAENWLFRMENPPPQSCTDFCDGVLMHTHGALPDRPEFSSFAWWSETAHRTGYDPVTGEHSASTTTKSGNGSYWIIETLHESSPEADTTQVWYRVLALGTGNSDTVVAVIESVVTRHWKQASHAEPGNPCSENGTGTVCGRLTWRVLR